MTCKVRLYARESEYKYFILRYKKINKIIIKKIYEYVYKFIKYSFTRVVFHIRTERDNFMVVNRNSWWWRVATDIIKFFAPKDFSASSVCLSVSFSTLVFPAWILINSDMPFGKPSLMCMQTHIRLNSWKIVAISLYHHGYVPDGYPIVRFDIST